MKTISTFTHVKMSGVVLCTWDPPANMHSHSHAQAEAQVDTKVLSERTPSSHDLCHRAQAKHLEYKHNMNTTCQKQTSTVGELITIIYYSCEYIQAGLWVYVMYSFWCIWIHLTQLNKELLLK